MNTEEEFWLKMDRSNGLFACWPYIGSHDSNGYGSLMWQGKWVRAHRLALILHLGRDLLPKMNACHHCDNPPCSNPWHLYEGTRSQNNKDMYARTYVHWGRSRTHCRNGHELTEENTKRSGATMQNRSCRTCLNEQRRINRIDLGLRVPVPCAWCGELFTRVVSFQLYCSGAHKKRAVRARAAATV